MAVVRARTNYRRASLETGEAIRPLHMCLYLAVQLGIDCTQALISSFLMTGSIYILISTAFHEYPVFLRCGSI